MNKFFATFILIIYSFTIFPVSLFAKDTTHTYDSLSRTTSTTLPDNSTTTQDYSIVNGKEIITSTDSLGNITEIEKKRKRLNNPYCPS